MHKTFVLLSILLLAGCIRAQKRSEVRVSLQYSCIQKPFLSVSAHTSGHQSFPNVELHLIDPRGRTAGLNNRSRLPRSQSGRIIEIPDDPNQSKVIGAEICDAIQGDYQVIVAEHHEAEYVLSVRANDGRAGSEAMSHPIQPSGDRTCQYRFRFLLGTAGPVKIRWLGNSGRQAMHPVCEPVPAS